MRTTLLFCLIAAAVCAGPSQARQQDEADSDNKKSPSSEQILKQLEDRYTGRNFSVDFRQESTLEAMDITDEASGHAWFKHPGKMRWEYLEPERQVIVSDGDRLWIHRPEDRQVMVGDAADQFANGKGASFLADFKLLEEVFEVSLEDCGENICRLKLVPREKKRDLAVVYLEVDRNTMDIKQVESENIYGDVTRIYLENLEFAPDMKNRLFEFMIPSGADVIRMEE
ncbi:MAG: outer membrane lipoprotein carrier protein LolA [Desulfosalsimonas sp.]